MDKLTLEQIEVIREQRRIKAERRIARRMQWSESAKRKSAVAYQEAERMMEAIPLGQPILVGHHSEKRDRAYRGRMNGKMEKAVEFDKIAEYHQQKAENILAFGMRVKGDAERERQAKREALDAIITVGTKVKDYCFGLGEVVKVNKKTYTIKFASDWKTTRDKTFVKKFEINN